MTLLGVCVMTTMDLAHDDGSLGVKAFTLLCFCEVVSLHFVGWTMLHLCHLFVDLVGNEEKPHVEMPCSFTAACFAMLFQ